MTADDLRTLHSRLEREIAQLRANCEEYLRQRGWYAYLPTDEVPAACVGLWRDPATWSPHTFDIALQRQLERDGDTKPFFQEW